MSRGISIELAKARGWSDMGRELIQNMIRVEIKSLLDSLPGGTHPICLGKEIMVTRLECLQ